MISPGLTITIDWLCLLLTYVIYGLRLAIRCSRKKKETAKYHTEVILFLVLAVATGSVSVNTWKNARLIRVGRSSHSPENESPGNMILSLQVCKTTNIHEWLTDRCV